MIESIILDMAVMNPACVVEWPGPASHTQTSSYLAQSPVRKVVNGQGGQGLVVSHTVATLHVHTSSYLAQTPV